MIAPSDPRKVVTVTQYECPNMAVTGPFPSFDIEELWEDLLAFIDEREVIPVVGRELLLADNSGEHVPLYHAVAAGLLERYGLTSVADKDQSNAETVALRPGYELNDAVCALARAGRRVQDLYRPINDLLRAMIAKQALPIPPALTQLAAIRDFDLFVSTTCDDLLARAINAERFGGTAQTEQIEYAPNLSSDKIRDIPELRSTGYTSVFYVFGKASALPQYAIHDEDILEFVHGLQTVRGHVPERMLGAMRSRNLLLIGCNLADWLSRFFIRLSNQTRLSGDRAKKEFLVDAGAARDASLTLFLERFSQNTRIFPGTAAEFVADLHRRWGERHAASADAIIDRQMPLVSGARRQDIFISYSSGDRPAAQRFVEELQAAGGNVVWFDRHDLSLGDDWRASILNAIRRCSLFVPLISANTERRDEGFFRLEWAEACERDRTIQGRKFVCPVVIDTDYAGNATRYVLIPEGFRKYQFGHAPGGQFTPELRQDIVAAIRDLRRPGNP